MQIMKNVLVILVLVITMTSCSKGDCVQSIEIINNYGEIPTDTIQSPTDTDDDETPADSTTNSIKKVIVVVHNQSSEYKNVVAVSYEGQWFHNIKIKPGENDTIKLNTPLANGYEKAYVRVDLKGGSASTQFYIFTYKTLYPDKINHLTVKSKRGYDGYTVRYFLE